MSLEPLVAMESEEVLKKPTMIVLCQRNRDQLKEQRPNRKQFEQQNLLTVLDYNPKYKVNTHDPILSSIKTE